MDSQSFVLSNLLSLSRHTVSMLSEAFALSTRDRKLKRSLENKVSAVTN
ncbi:MAG: hypothetical protein KME32_30620 [Mojavia pulchra JT2-VF2]|uniref:Uncharacterized protein n=1 Tax=Mojavia pulchra JT2-VF2 TaxID=287848 RepID=A0A951Q5X3_9NOST|nr:hypothetical protein [Mojavia pulchra JT2-VF2]